MNYEITERRRQCVNDKVNENMIRLSKKRIKQCNKKDNKLEAWRKQKKKKLRARWKDEQLRTLKTQELTNERQG